jgi:hypothetical protein
MSAVALDRERLGKLLGILRSNLNGEVVAAGRAADRLIRKPGLLCPDVILPTLASPERVSHTVADVIEFVIDHEHALTPWERDFVRLVQRLRYPVSAKETEMLKRLFGKACPAGARAP